MNADPSKKPLVPAQQQGAKSDTVEAATFETEKEAAAFFDLAKQRLLNVSDWYKLCGLGSATFTLTDSNGETVKRPVEQGDHLKIDIPAPGTGTGGGYDWVRIEAVENKVNEAAGYEAVSMRARPAQNPKDPSGDTAHFFKNKATSTFIVVREKNIVRAEIHGRNELPNVKQETKIDSLRNFFIALGAMLGFSKFQWSKLVKGIVSQESR